MGLAASACRQQPERKVIPLEDFRPKSMLHVPETRVERAAFPVIDIHTHLSWARKSEHGVGLTEEREFMNSCYYNTKKAGRRLSRLLRLPNL